MATTEDSTGSLFPSTVAPTPPEPAWSVALNIFGATVGFVGFIANVAAFIIIGRLSKSLSQSSRLILRHQAVLDGTLCVISAINLLQPLGMPRTGNLGLDRFLCHIWWGQTINWTLIALSIWNLVIFAVDRFIAIVFPFKYRSMSISKFVIMLTCAYLLSVLVFVAGVFQVSTVDGQCGYTKLVQSHATEVFYNVYVYLWFFMAYVIPVSAFLLLYGWIVITLKRSQTFQKKSSDDRSSTIEKALLEVTRTGIVVTVIFIIAMSFDTFYYFLDRVTTSVVYIPHSPFQRFAVLMISVNMIVNPFIYVILMPLYRRQLRTTFTSFGDTIRRRSGHTVITGASSQIGSTTADSKAVKLSTISEPPNSQS